MTKEEIIEYLYSINCQSDIKIEEMAEDLAEKARPTGEWEYTQYDGDPNIGNWHCSECKHIVPGMYISKPEDNFCSFCGADMRGYDNDRS